MNINLEFENLVGKHVNVDWRSKAESDKSVNFWKNVKVIKTSVFGDGKRMVFVEGYLNCPVDFDAVNNNKGQNGLPRVTPAS